MSAPILATKLFMPTPRPNAVHRPRLLAQLRQGLDDPGPGFARKLTLISAPAGFGKTTLAAAWLAPTPDQPGPPVAWLSLEPADNDLARFLAYLAAALGTVAGHVGEGLAAVLRGPHPPPMEPLLTALVNRLADLPNPAVLVLDDYHAIHSRAVDEAVTFLLEHLPPTLHLVIVTREDPPLPLSRLRARGQLTELRARDLRFTPDEAAVFLNQAMGLALSAEAVAALEARTEGWIAGLQLAALSLQGRADPSGFIQTFTGSHRFVLDYLVEEVLQRQPESIRTFLLQTAILDRLCGPLCDAVTGQEGGQEMLETLERGNLFVVPLDDERRWYRYHHLFAEMLLVRAQGEWPDRLPCLHRRASGWYAQHDLPAQAIRHALAAQDWPRAAGLIELAWPAMDGQFQADAWIAWAGKLPEEVIRARPVLSVAYAWALLNGGELEGGLARLDEAERCLESAVAQMVIADPEQLATLPASMAAARAYIAQALGDTPGSVVHARQALDLLPEDDYLTRGQAGALRGLAEWAMGDLDAAHDSLANAMHCFAQMGNEIFALSGTYGMADIRVAQGRLREATAIYQRATRLAQRLGEELGEAVPGTADIHLGLSQIYREQGKLDAARQEMERCEALGEPAGLGDFPFRVRRARAEAMLDQGDHASALLLLDDAERHYLRSPVPMVKPIPAMRARVWLAQGRLAEALAWARERGLSLDDEISFLSEFEHLTLAYLLMAQDKHGAALPLLDRLGRAAEAGGRTGSVIEIGIAQALAHHAQNDIPGSLSALERTLTLAEPEGYVQVFVRHGAAMAALLAEAAKAGISSNYVRRLRAAMGAPTAGAPVDPPLLDPLSDREFDVLKLLVTEMNGPEIARELVVSLNTLRTHTKNIYGKLGVNSRRAAINRAQDLGLI
ncbi:LuxR C-terminal-related transcriptional regulator [Litorilinea aerophila]|uniref:Helix-turn-helix transcriptional regulator n=1 Tax=Litorilinea aerophila TaxID=1204385 RepID=A0A540VEL0_9CHLR|nr:LuxR C-terminal-related transcriptional regulator [Litorilinea aerophila]MCC9077601.1 LuxR C-terminal-related transcriptional regulator [Litorilinea aerophila]